jgi:hypothetical protein
MSTTAAAIEARRAATAEMLQRVDQALRQMRRERARITIAAGRPPAGFLDIGHQCQR